MSVDTSNGCTGTCRAGCRMGTQTISRANFSESAAPLALRAYFYHLILMLAQHAEDGVAMSSGTKRSRYLGTALLIGASLIVALCPATAASADPYTAAEVAYLNDMHQWAAGINEDDAHLLSDGWYACHLKATGINTDAAGIDPAISFYASRDLCPNGCPPPGGCRGIHPGQ
ncbi:MAG: hypothetical protein KDE45_01500 [Caldilineaceae bacterium]|nr:hypothetical protein [Caldilineaceae bacterium]